MASRELPAPASLENLRKQAKGLHKAFKDGDDDAVTRIAEHLPRASELIHEDLRGLDLSLQEAQHVLARIYAELATVAQCDGMLALEAYIPRGQRTGAFHEGVRLAVEGIASLQAGDNPWIIFHKMQVHYLDAGVAEALNRCREEITGDELHDWIERGWLGVRASGDLAVTFLHLGFAARNEGIQALAPAADAIQQPLIKTGLGQLIANRQSDSLRDELTGPVEAQIDRLERHHQAAAAGLLAVAAGKTSQEAAQAVRDAAA